MIRRRERRRPGATCASSASRDRSVWVPKTRTGCACGCRKSRVSLGREHTAARVRGNAWGAQTRSSCKSTGSANGEFRYATPSLDRDRLSWLMEAAPNFALRCERSGTGRAERSDGQPLGFLGSSVPYRAYVAGEAELAFVQVDRVCAPHGLEYALRAAQAHRPRRITDIGARLGDSCRRLS
jgi:hypothetical protein